MKLKITVEEAKKLTMEKFNVSESDVNYITDDFLSHDFVEFDPSLGFAKEGDKTIATGHNIAYGRNNNGDFVYVFDSSPHNECGNIRYVWLQRDWNHYSAGRYCGGIQDFRHAVIVFQSI